MADEGAASGGYRAFLSYSHMDAGWGAKLHRRLESYSLPNRLVGTETVRGIVPERLAPIFRDREELPAGESLSDTIKAALAVSDSLIVMCSAGAKASPWVAKEIALFRELHPDRPVLAALVAGEPAEAFPEGLMAGGVEPIAADFRKSGDGERLALLKLAAGMTGVPLDALVQRDAQRQMRRVTAITSLAMAAVLVMALLTTFAFRAQTEAERQRAEAEGLVEYMLTDLRDRLKGVGRLDVMTAVNERAMKYYGGQGDLSRLPARSLLRRARILHAMGEDEVTRGDLSQAQAYFVEAHRRTSAALAQQPDNLEAMYSHGQSEYWLGRVGELRADWGTASTRYRNYAALGEKLVAAKPGNPDYLMERGWGDLNRGIVLQRGLKHHAEAEPLFESAIGWFEKAQAKRPGDARIMGEIGNARAWLADSFFIRDRFREALTERLTELRIKRDIAQRDARDVSSLARLADCEYAIGRTYLELGRHREAADYLRDAFDRYERLRLVEPGNSAWLLQSAQIASSRIAAEAKLGRDREYRDALTSADTYSKLAIARGIPGAESVRQHFVYRRSNATLAKGD